MKSYQEIEDILKDLRNVGKTKSLGYLPISTIENGCGVNINIISDELIHNGLGVLKLSPDESGIRSGALYTYDEKWLSNILIEGKDILTKNSRPFNPIGFIYKLKFLAEDKDLYELIMRAFADPRLLKKNSFVYK